MMSGTEIAGVMSSIGGVGAVCMAVVRHMPAPSAARNWRASMYRWLFDSLQDIFKNNDRIGERETEAV